MEEWFDLRVKMLLTRTLRVAMPLRRTLAVMPFKLADIGEGIAEVELMKWFVKPGDNVKAFDRICEVQSDKATVEITSRYDGVIVNVLHEEGAIVKVGSSLVDINVKGDASSVDKVNNNPKGASSPPLNIPASNAGGSERFNSRDATIDHSNSKIQTTPAVRKLAKENNIDLSVIQGSGPKGRISKEDVLVFINNNGASTQPFKSVQTNSSTQNIAGVVAPPPTHSSSGASNNTSVSSAKAMVGDKVVPIRGVQRLMVKSMTAALQVQHLTYSDEIIVDSLIKLRKDLKESNSSAKISFMPLLIKAASLALLHYPMLNATVSPDASEMIHHANHNIGIAMDTSKGLVVPVIKGCQNKSVFDIANDLNALQTAALNGTITEAQLSGGTFTLSNIGSIGGTYAVPVLVVPQVTIGAFGRHQIVPRYVDSADNTKPASSESIYDGKAVVKPTTIMNISWSADHRVVDGATVAKFSNLFKQYLEKPSTMFANMK